MVRWREFEGRAPIEEELRSWWKQWPQASPAMVTGRASGIFVLDVDAHRGGIETLRDLEGGHDRLPDTPIARTPSGGVHYFFLMPEGTIRTRANVWPGIDIRGDGGIAVLPPGRGRSWVGVGLVDHDPVEAPAWLVEAMRTRRPARPAVAGAEAWLAPSREGGRHDAMASIVGRLAATNLTKEEAWAVVTKWNEGNPTPMDDAEIETQFDDMWERWQDGNDGPFTAEPANSPRGVLTPGADGAGPGAVDSPSSGSEKAFIDGLALEGFLGRYIKSRSEATCQAPAESIQLAHSQTVQVMGLRAAVLPSSSPSAGNSRP